MPHREFMCFLWFLEETAIISLHYINWMVFTTETECVYCAVRTGSLYSNQVNARICSRDVAQEASLLPLISERRVPTQVSPCETSGGQSDTGTCFSPSSSVSPCQHHSTNVPYSASCEMLLLPDGKTGDFLGTFEWSSIYRTALNREILALSFEEPALSLETTDRFTT